MNAAALIRATAAGDKSAFERLYNQMQRPMLAYALGLLAGDRSAAEDAVDEAFLALWTQADSFTGGADNGQNSGEAWVRRLVRNKAVDWLRRQKSARTEVLTTTHEWLADDGDGPEQAAISADAAHWLRGALTQLSVDQREAVLLAYFEDRSVADIASIIGCPVGTVKTRLFHARQILRGRLTKAEDA